VGSIFVREAQRRGLTIREVISVGTFYMAVPLVLRGMGVAVLDEFTARSAPDRGAVFQGFDPPLRFEVRCIHLEDRPLSHLAEAFLEVLRGVLREVAPGS